MHNLVKGRRNAVSFRHAGSDSQPDPFAPINEILLYTLLNALKKNWFYINIRVMITVWIVFP